MSAVELYEFSLYSAVWRYTSADVGYVADGHMFAPLPGLSRGVVERSGDASRTEHKVTCPVGLGPAALFATGTPDGVLRLRILRLENGGTSVVWQGRVLGCESAGVTATLTCEPVFTTIKAPGLRRMFTPSCPHDFCDSLCQPPDNNGNYSEPNRAYAVGAAHVFDPGLYFHTGAASQEHPPENIWDQDPATYGEVIEPGGGDWTSRYKEQFYEEDQGGCVHTFEIYEYLERDLETGDLSYSLESYEYWECPDYEEIYTSIDGTQGSDGVAHYVQTDPEEAAWDDPAGLPALEDYTSIETSGGLYRAGVEHPEPVDVGMVAALLWRDGADERVPLLVQHSDDGETWTTAGLEGDGVEHGPQGDWQQVQAHPFGWKLLRPAAGSGSHRRWAVASPDPFGLCGLRFFRRSEPEDCKCSPIEGAALSWTGTPSETHPPANILDNDSGTYGEITGEACRLILDLGQAVNVAAAWFDAKGLPEGLSSGRLQLQFSDDGEEWSLTDAAFENLSGMGGFPACRDFGAHRWWSLLGLDGLVRLSGFRLFRRGRLVRSDEPRPRTLWKNGSVWELDAVVSAVDGASVTAPGLSAKADGFFDSGLLVSEAGAREILAHAGDTLTLRRALPSLAPGSRISVRAGCDKTKETCNSRGNIANFGGWPFIPWKNPMSGETIY